jgi:hypothetical protein
VVVAGARVSATLWANNHEKEEGGVEVVAGAK